MTLLTASFAVSGNHAGKRTHDRRDDNRHTFWNRPTKGSQEDPAEDQQ
jgi:hypothetical protein